MEGLGLAPSSTYIRWRPATAEAGRDRSHDCSRALMDDVVKVLGIGLLIDNSKVVVLKEVFLELSLV